MSRNHEVLSQLLRVKRLIGISRPSHPPPAVDEEAAGPKESWTTCVNCQYCQQGVISDRCPECGLPFAAWYRDPTRRYAPRISILGWFSVAYRIWAWDARLRTRASLIRTTPESRRFAIYSVLFTAGALAVSLAAVNVPSIGPKLLVGTYFLLHCLTGTVLAGLLLTLTLLGLAQALSGTWRRRFLFVPAAIHYATAWWPPGASLVLALACMHAISPDSDIFRHATLLCLLCGLPWALWLWASIAEADLISLPSVRIIGVASLAVLVGILTLGLIPSTVRLGMTQALATADSGLTVLRMFGTFGSDQVTSAPRTYALVIDAIPSKNDDLVLEGIERLGVGRTTRVYMEEEDCSLDEIRNALYAARRRLRADDKFVLYINGHGSRDGAGSIRVADGEITTQMLADQLAEMPTRHSLVVIDSCFGGKFIKALRDRGSCNAVVLTSTDDQNLAYNGALEPFWKALTNPAPDDDEDGNGVVTVDEAFWRTFRPMIEGAEETRQAALARHAEGCRHLKLLTDVGYATPQLEALGAATEEDFGVDAPTPESQQPEDR